jgi:hypothetical protein
MKRRTILTASLAALTTGLAQTGKQEKKGVRVIPDLTKEAHQMALMLLLMYKPNRDYFYQYDDYSRSNAFAQNGISLAVYQKARSAYSSVTDQTALTNALFAFRAQVLKMGAKVQANNNVYPPGDPCPYMDQQLNSPTAKKLTA